jgi:hypothetical protein
MEKRFRYDEGGNLFVKVVFAVKNAKYPQGIREIMWVKVLGQGTKTEGTGKLDNIPKVVNGHVGQMLHYKTHPDHGRIFDGWCKSHLHLVESVNHRRRDENHTSNPLDTQE